MEQVDLGNAQGSGVIDPWKLPRPWELRERGDVKRNLREARVWGRYIARSYDRGCTGFDGALLLDLIERARVDLEWLRIYGGKVDDEARQRAHIKIQEQLSAAEIGVTRLLGIPCEFGQYSLRNKPLTHPMFATIPPLTGLYRRAFESQQMPAEAPTQENGRDQSTVPSDH